MIPHSLIAKSGPSKVKIQLENIQHSNQYSTSIDDALNASNNSEVSSEFTGLSNDKFRSMFFK